jgi:hypothetical protein
VRAVYAVRAVLKPQLAVASLLMFRQMREAFNDDELLSRFDIEEAMAEVTRWLATSTRSTLARSCDRCLVGWPALLEFGKLDLFILQVSFGEQSEEQMERERISRSKFQKKGDGAKEEMSTDQLKELEHVNVPYGNPQPVLFPWCVVVHVAVVH